MQSTTSSKQVSFLSLFISIFVLRFVRIGRCGNRVLFRRLNQLHQLIGREAIFTDHANDVGILDGENVRINLLVASLQRGNLAAVLLAFLFQFDNFGIHLPLHSFQR